MTDPRRVSTRRAVLSYAQLKELFKKGGFNAPDLFVKDYQGIILDTSYVADEIDGLEITVIQNKEDIAELRVDLDELQLRVEVLEGRIPEYIETSTPIAVSGFKVVNCINATPIDITLGPSIVGDTVNIKRTNAAVNVIGVIDGMENVTINAKRYSMKLYCIGNEWIEI